MFVANFVLYISSSWVEIKLHTKNWPLRLSRSALSGPTKYFVTPNLALLGCIFEP